MVPCSAKSFPKVRREGSVTRTSIKSRPRSAAPIDLILIERKLVFLFISFLSISMRSIGAAERGLDLMLVRVTDPSRRTFGKLLAEHGTIVSDIAKSRMIIDQARFLVLNAADKIDKVGAKNSLKEIGMAKVFLVGFI